MSLSAADDANQQLVDSMIVEGSLWSSPLIAAFRATPRHRFLDRVFQFQGKQNSWREILTREPSAEEIRLVYSDRALITHLSPANSGQPAVPVSSSSQPSLMAQMLEDLRLCPGCRVLEIGAGTGYNAALMAHVTGPNWVTSIDVDRSVLSEAWDHLRAFPDRQVQFKHADGRLGDPGGAPFDRIIVAAATPDLEHAWLEQLAPDGILVAPLALAPGLAYVIRGTVREGVLEGRPVRAAYFMPLRKENESGAEGDEAPPEVGGVRNVTSPWAECFDRKWPRTAWLRFVHSLAFFGLLQGLKIRNRGEAGPTVFGVEDGEGRRCWFGPQTCEVSGEEGRLLGWNLWRAWADLGGPWPTEYRVRASAGALPLQGKPQEYGTRGPRCNHVWDLPNVRDRA